MDDQLSTHSVYTHASTLSLSHTHTRMHTNTDLPWLANQPGSSSALHGRRTWPWPNTAHSAVTISFTANHCFLGPLLLWCHVETGSQQGATISLPCEGSKAQ